MSLKNAKGKKGKKGVLFSLLTLLLAILLLSLASFLSQESWKAKRSASQIAKVDRAVDAFSNIEDNLREIAALRANITAQNSTLLIEERLPSRSAEQHIQRYKAFAENYSDLQVSVGTGSISAGGYIVQPSGALISHPAGSLLLDPSGAVSWYDIELLFDSADADFAFWSEISQFEGAEALPVSIRVRDTRYAFIMDFHETLNRTGISVFNVTKSGATVATLRFSPDSALEASSSQDMGLKASIGFPSPIYVETDDVISVVSDVNKTARIRIA